MPLLKEQTTEEKITHLLDSSMRDWNSLQHNMLGETKEEIIRYLDRLMERSARLRGYLNTRYGNGCGDGGHASAVKESNRLAWKVRKALGFIQPRKDITY